MKTYDSIVVGAGPAGATAAYRLARHGLDVLVLDKKLFPRHKPCGGALSPKAYRQIDFDISDIVKLRVRRTRVRGPGRSTFFLESENAEAWMVSRNELDLRLLQHASQAGALVRQGEPVEAILAGGRIVRTARDEYRARTLVGADGCGSLVARALGLDRPRPRRLRSLHLEGQVLGGPREEAVLDFAYRGGYAWAFPKGDLLNVGICTRDLGWSLRPALEGFLKKGDLALAGAPSFHSWPIPVGGRHRPLHRGTALLVGDAAGLADPLLGEGIAYAMMSARLAAWVIADHLKGGSEDLAGYSDTVRRTLHRDLKALALGSALLYRFPRFFLALLHRSRGLQTLAINVVSGQRSPSGIWTQEASD